MFFWLCIDIINDADIAHTLLPDLCDIKDVCNFKKVNDILIDNLSRSPKCCSTDMPLNENRRQLVNANLLQLKYDVSNYVVLKITL